MSTIRPALRADAELLPDIERSAGQAFLVLPDLAWIAEDDVQSVDEHLQAIASGDAWVAVDDDDKPLGFLNGAWFGDRFHILLVAVRHDHQRCGLGRALVEYAADDARRRGSVAVTLTTFRDVPWNRPFYEKLGFQVLEGDAIPKEIRKILLDEVAHGIPGETRCAMIRPLR